MFGWGVKTISAEELADELGRSKPLLIDVREPNEYAGGHVRGAINIPLGSLKQRLGKFDPDARTLLICESGHRSKTAAAMMQRAGFTDVHSVRGGTRAWKGPLKR